MSCIQGIQFHLHSSELLNHVLTIMADAELEPKADTPREAESTNVVELSSSSSETTTTGTGAGSETAKSTAPIQPTQTAAKGGSVSDLDRQIAALRRCEYLKESEVKAICAKAREILVDESNVQRVDAPVTVSGNLFFRYTAPPVFYLSVVKRM